MSNKINLDPLAIISHEIKTPIAVINGNIENLEYYYKAGRLEDLDLNQIIQAIKRNCARLIKISNDMIDIMRMGIEENNIKMMNFDIALFLQRICSLTLSEFNQNEIDIAFKSNKDKVYINGNPNLIERMVLNLFSNAIKFSKDNCIIKVTLTDREYDIVLKVSDNGIGIPKEYIDKILEPFVQVDSSSSRIAEGMGLGLSIVKGVVKIHKGEITVKSSKKGTTFEITLPKDLDKLSSTLSSEEFTSIIDHEIIKIELSDIK